MLQLTLHGTSGWYETNQGCTMCTELLFEDQIVYFDFGTGVRRINSEVVKGKEVSIFLSHLHLDHVFGLHLLPKFEPGKVNIFVAKELKKHLKALLTTPFMKDVKKHPFEISIIPLDEGELEQEKFSIQALNVVHNTTVMAYRFSYKNLIVGYCTDTRKCLNVSKIASKADVFICEAASKNGESIKNRFHMSSEDAACIAQEAKVKKLILTHFGPTRYPSKEDRENVLEGIDSIYSKTVIGQDGLQLHLKVDMEI